MFFRIEEQRLFRKFKMLQKSSFAHLAGPYQQQCLAPVQ